MRRRVEPLHVVQRLPGLGHPLERVPRQQVTAEQRSGTPAVEGYPVEPSGGRTAPVFAFTGLA